MNHDDGREATSLADAIAARRRLSEAQPETLIPRATVTLMLDVLSAANRRRVAAAMFAKTDDGSSLHRFWKSAYERAETQEDAALDALAAHWGVGGDE